MAKRRPYLNEGIVNKAIAIWKGRHRLNDDSTFSESSVLEDILKDWIKKEAKE